MKQQYTIYLTCKDEYNGDLIKALKALKRTLKEVIGGPEILFKIEDPCCRKQSDTFPLRAIIRTSYFPATIIDFIGSGLSSMHLGLTIAAKQQYGGKPTSPELSYIVDAGNNNLFSNNPYYSFFVQELNIITYTKSVTSSFLSAIKDELISNEQGSDISYVKILEVKYVKNTSELCTELLQPLEYKYPWSPVNSDGSGYNYDHKIYGDMAPQNLFKALYNLRRDSNSKYSGQYIEKMDGILLDGVISCKDIYGQSALINLSKIASITPYTDVPEVPGLKIRFFETSDKKLDVAKLELLDVFVETTSFVSKVLNIKDFPKMEIHRVMPELIADQAEVLIPGSVDPLSGFFYSQLIDMFKKHYAAL